MTPNPSKTTTTIGDGYGRAVESQLTSDSEGTTYADTAWHPMLLVAPRP